MNAAEYSLRVFERISGGHAENDAPALRSAIELDLPEALRKLAQMSIGTSWQSLLENDYALTIAGSSASFGTNTDLLPESIKACGKITHTSVLQSAGVLLPFRILDSVDDLSFEGAVSYSPFAFAAVGLSAVEFRYAGGTLTSVLTVRAIKVPTLVSIAASTAQQTLEDRLIDAGAILALMKGQSAANGSV